MPALLWLVGALVLGGIGLAVLGEKPSIVGFPMRLREARRVFEVRGLLAPPGAPATVSTENEWRIGELESVEMTKLSWGWCFSKLIKARLKANMTTESDLAQWFARWTGRRMDWVVATLRVVTLGIDACWRMTVPAIKVRIEGRELYLCQRPEAALPSQTGYIGGWNPGSLRPGWKATVESFPEGKIWIKYLGDYWGWEKTYGLRVLVWHLVIWQEGATKYEVGSLKSFLAMSKKDWRRAFLVGEPAWQYDPLGPLGWFVKNSVEGEFDIRFSSHSKAMDRFR